MSTGTNVNRTLRLPLPRSSYLYGKLYWSRFNWMRTGILASLSDVAETNAKIVEGLNGRRPFLVGRMGGTETRVCWHYFRRIHQDMRHAVPYKKKWAEAADQLSGITPNDDHSLDQFASIYLSSIVLADLIGVWNVRGMYELLHSQASPGLCYTDLESLDPWPAYRAGLTPWTQALKGKTVLVIHPFAASIESQYAARQTIKTIRDILPDFTLKTLVPPVTFAGNHNEKTWVENLSQLCADTAAAPFDVAIIGCGAYGLPLGSFIKQMGRKAVHLGGATQLLFGIRGARWDILPEMTALMDETWVRPRASETPAQAKTVEDACYW